MSFAALSVSQTKKLRHDLRYQGLNQPFQHTNQFSACGRNFPFHRCGRIGFIIQYSKVEAMTRISKFLHHNRFHATCVSLLLWSLIIVVLVDGGWNLSLASVH